MPFIEVKSDLDIASDAELQMKFKELLKKLALEMDKKEFTMIWSWQHIKDPKSITTLKISNTLFNCTVLLLSNRNKALSGRFY